MKRFGLMLIFSLFFFFSPPVRALGESMLKGRVVSLQDSLVQVELESGEVVSALYSPDASASLPPLKPNERILLSPNLSSDSSSSAPYVVADFSRTRPLLVLAILFFVVTLGITASWGFKSFLGMAFSFYLIFKLLLPQIMAGQDPVLITIITSLFIIPVTFYLSHGFNRKTNSAILGTIAALVITGLLATLFASLAHLTGLASEEAGFIFAFTNGAISPRGLLLAGIILGTLGVLDDVTISQAAIVTELKDSNPRLAFKELFARAMRVGHDHISSMVNTLVLVYTGASLPLLLLFLDSSQSFSSVINNEIIAAEVVRTLVGSIGLILAVPLTTFIAVSSVSRRR